MRAFSATVVAFFAMILLPQTVLPAQDYKPGDKVVVITSGHLRVDGNEQVDRVWPGLTLPVEAVNGNWIWLNNGKPGWLDKSKVVPLDRRAVEKLTELIDATSKTVTKSGLYQGRAEIWWRLGELDIAIADLNEAIRLYPDYSGFYGDRGSVWHEKKEYGKAISDHDEAIRLNPSSALQFSNRAEAWFDKKEYDNALADCNEAIRLDVKFVLAYHNRGDVRRKLGAYAAAISDYNEVLRLDPQYASGYKERAWLRAACPDAKFRDGKQAVKDATRGCELGGWKDAYHVDTLAAASAEAGDFPNAIKWQQQAIELTTDKDEVEAMQARLELYKSDKPYRDEPNQ